MDKYLDKYRIPSSRLKGYDYGSSGIYFVTICTKHHKHYFGEIKSTFGRVNFQYSEIGEKAIEFWKQIPQHFPFVELDEYIVMPDLHTE